MRDGRLLLALPLAAIAFGVAWAASAPTTLNTTYAGVKVPRPIVAGGPGDAGASLRYSREDHAHALALPVCASGQALEWDGGSLACISRVDSSTYATFAGDAGYAAQCASASSAATAVWASYAADAGYATQAGTAAAASSAAWATFAGDAGFAALCASASSAGTAGWATFAGDAGYALEANHAATADLADLALSAASTQAAVYAIFAGDAGYAQHAAETEYATTSDYAYDSAWTDNARALALHCPDAGYAVRCWDNGEGLFSCLCTDTVAHATSAAGLNGLPVIDEPNGGEVLTYSEGAGAWISSPVPYQTSTDYATFAGDAGYAATAGTAQSLAGLPVCPGGQALGYDGGFACLAVSAGGPALVTLAANAIVDTGTVTVVGAGQFNAGDYASQTCTWEVSGSTSDTNVVLTGLLYNLTDGLDAGPAVAISGISTVNAASAALSLPQTAKLYEVRAYLADAGPTSTGTIRTAMMRCQ